MLNKYFALLVFSFNMKLINLEHLIFLSIFFFLSHLFLKQTISSGRTISLGANVQTAEVTFRGESEELLK